MPHRDPRIRPRARCAAAAPVICREFRALRGEREWERALLDASPVSIRLERLLPAATLFFAVLVCRASHAAPTARDGFYLQMTAGIGFPHIEFTVDDPSHSNTYADAQNGTSLGSSLLLGASLRPGLVLGVGGLGALYLSKGSHPTSTADPGDRVYLVDVKDPPFHSVAMLGPFVDIYPSPTLGWHVQALVGYAALSGRNFYSDGGSSGVGLMLGGGHDFWVSKHWSIGLLARVSYANTSLAEDYAAGDTISEQDTFVSPSFEVSFTFH